MEDHKDTAAKKWVTMDGEISDEEIKEGRKEFLKHIQSDKQFVAKLKRLPEDLWKEIEDMVHAEGIKIAGEDEETDNRGE
ncbi:MAG: hypothetical protein J5758_01505 [Abditibacteriota bacterium]|nr:hypothetical protein [Abditibacteriota bacterium]